MAAGESWSPRAAAAALSCGAWPGCGADIRLGRGHWPGPRRSSGGLAVIAVAMSAIGRYGTTFFWVHMVQHLLLIMVAPGVADPRPAADPGDARHAGTRWHTRIKRLLRSRVVTVVTCPLVAIPLYAVVVVGTHLTSFNNRSSLIPAPPVAEQLAYLVCGYLYLLSGFGEEPIRWRLSRPTKIVVLVLSMPIDTFTGITLLMTNREPWPGYALQHHTWGPDPLTDVHYGGAMMWIGGDTIMIAVGHGRVGALGG